MKNMLAQPWVIAARNKLRSNRIAQTFYQRWMASHDYEERFGQRLLASVNDSTVVWDVGANVGLYTRQFLDAGARHVVAFEPAPQALEVLNKDFGTSSPYAHRVTIVPAALSDRSGVVRFSADGSSPTNRIVDQGVAAANDLVEIRSVRAEEALRMYSLPPPGIVKIDVEGFEVEVLRGFGSVMGTPELRGVFVEVHFTRLHERGLDAGPAEISRLFKAQGFKLQWLDLSHLCAIRDTRPSRAV